jgi:lycopene beta-cyclase
MADSAPLRVALIGGGLHNLLLASRLLKQQHSPRHRQARQLEIEIFESQSRFQTDKTISCHASDIPLHWEPELEPFWRCKWPSYHVRFAPGPFINIPIGYRSLDLVSLARHIESSAAHAAGLTIHFDRAMDTLPPGFDLVIDSASALGVQPTQPTNFRGVQQFFGQTLSFGEPHKISLPIVMDSTIPQSGGYCFVYVLPMSDRELLIEDTRLLGRQQIWQNLEDAVPAYLNHLGLANRQYTVVHEERGTLPIPLCSLNRWQGAVPRHSEMAQAHVIKVGFRAGYFHPTTGYSLPLALRSIDSLCKDIESACQGNASVSPKDLAFYARNYDQFTRSCRSSWAVALIFNRFLLWGFRPDQAHNAFAYFYALPLEFIRRFYRAELRLRDLKPMLSRLPPRRFQLIRMGARLLSFWLGLGFGQSLSADSTRPAAPQAHD